MTDVLAFSDNPNLASELTTAALSLAPGAGGGPLSIKVSGQASGDPQLTATAIAEIVKKRGPAIVLVGATKFGRMVAGSLAVQLRTGVLSDVRSLEVDGQRLIGTRGAYAGKFNATVESPIPCIALVPQGAYGKPPGGSVPEETATTEAQSRVRRTGTEAHAPSLDLRNAKLIVSAGRGFRKKDDLGLAEKLARAIGGTMGASRPLSSDLGWLGEEYHIGLTGVYVHPDLYLAIGISGQLQHVAGIRDSKVIAAINKDKQAPIFQVVDYGVVGDLYEVIPALLKLLGAA